MNRRTILAALSGVGVIAALVVPLASASAAVSPGTVGTGALFEDNDANLAVDSGAYLDWNSFAPATWNGSSPYQNASATASNGSQLWSFTGLTDAMASTSDTGFAGGTKQDDVCPKVIGTKSPNKDDLQSAYLATSVGSNGHIYLMLAWERIAQNTTSPSAHVAFEFNQATPASAPCPASAKADSLVQRTPGDMLIVYDFTGGSTSTPQIELSRWLGAGSTLPCQVGSHTPPCWGVQTELTSLSPPQAEGAVNTGLSPYPGAVTDAVAQGSYLSPGGPLTLGTSQFGEAGIDLTAASVFPANSCLTFGTVDAVSRSSGDSSTAQMKDLVGPGHINVTNCGEIKIIKHTDPRGVDKSFSYTSDLSGPGSTSPPSPDCTQSASDPTSFTLNDTGNSGGGDSAANTQDCTNVLPGTYHVTETMPDGWQLESLSCSPTSDTSTSGLTATFVVTSGSTATCTYQNQELLGAIKITKSGKDKNCLGANDPAITNGVCTGPGEADLSGAKFDVSASADDANPISVQTGSDGTACVANLPFNSGGSTYYVTETHAPTGYSRDTTTAQTVSVTESADCSGSGTPAAISFSDSPLTDLKITVNAEVPGATNSTITCVAGPAGSGSGIGNSPKSGDPVTVTANGLVPGTYTCTVVVDP